MLQYIKYKLNFREPFRIAGNEYESREGIILVYKEGNITAFGEAAPLPGFSKESLEDVRSVLTMNHRNLEKSIRGGDGEESLRLLNRIHSFPSLSFALDTLLHDLAAKNEELSLGEHKFGQESQDLPCNFTIPMQSEEAALTAAKQASENGFKTLKVKVGDDFDQEQNILKTLREELGDVKIRIDANGSWSPKKAIKNLKALEKLDIEFCEQPVEKNDISGMVKVRKGTSIPIAADESLRSKNGAIRIIGEKAADIFIIKPMLFGLIQDISVTKQLADSHDIELVFTSSLESTVGRAATAILAAGLGSKKYAHGLATGNFFTKDITDIEFLKDGLFQFNNKPGIGVPVEVKELQQMSV